MHKRTFKVDLHVHSKHSTRPSQWVLQKIGCPESFTDPLRLYAVAKARGMDMVTVTDHNTIAGSLEIAHLDDTFVSEEITTYFPEDRCKLHVLAYDITEAQHADFQPLRENVFELVPYLREQGIPHVLAHPLFAVNDRLTPEHFEQCLLLFNHFELNGSRDQMQNAVLTEIIGSLTRQTLDELADRHNLAPHGDRPWIKYLSGGSDDHSSLNIARLHTEFDGPATVDNLLAQIEGGRGRVRGTPATPETLAHNLYGIAYQFYKSRMNVGPTSSKHVCFRFADHALDFGNVREETRFSRWHRFIGRSKTALHAAMSASGDTAQDVLLRQATSIITRDPVFAELAEGKLQDVSRVEQEWSRFVSVISSGVLSEFADRLLECVTKARIFDLFHTIGSAGSLYALLAPYFVSYDLFARERSFCNDILTRFGHAPRLPRRSGLKVAHFTDTYDEVNGVARTIKQQVALVNKHRKNMTVVTCGHRADEPGVATFRPVGEFVIPEYPEISLKYPPFLEMLAYCFEQDFDFILAATPGPVGLAALVISRILKIPFHGTYHTAFPQYVGMLTGDTVLEDGAWRYMLWFYNQMDVVYAPSEATRRELMDKGVPGDKIKVYPRGVDIARFTPEKRNGFYKRFDMAPDLQRAESDGDKRIKLLYVGRVSREKDLGVLSDAFRKLAAIRPELHLVVVGDGPYLAEMRAELSGLPVTFTGVLEGDDLAQAYASADLFVFPSTTDTFGNVVLEAQASGLPVVVTNVGGPCENVLDGETGVVCRGKDVDSLAEAVRALTDDPKRLAAMRDKARRYSESRTFDSTFLQTWRIFRDYNRVGRAS